MAAPFSDSRSLVFKLYGWLEGGVTFNPDQPADRQNFGRLFTDRANEPLFNQAVITLERRSPAPRLISTGDSNCKG